MVIKLLTRLERRVDVLSEKFNTERENMKKKTNQS